MIFKRKIYNELLQWKRTDEGRTAVLIQGARRVGKSTIAEEFATNEYETHILVDFAACSTEIRDLFNDVSDLNRIFMRLQLEYGVELKERKSVIIFDEVQLVDFNSQECQGHPDPKRGGQTPHVSHGL